MEFCPHQLSVSGVFLASLCAFIQLESPSRVEIYNSGSSVHGHHESRAIESGQYKVCFMVAPVAIATGKKTFNVQFYWDILPQGSQLYAHEVSANSVVNLQSPEHVTTPSVWNPKESTTLDISPTPNLQVAALRFDLSQVFKPEDLALILETSMHASVRLHIAYAEKPNAMCRLISPRRSKKDDPLASALADGSNLKRTPRGMTGSGGWYGYRWDEASFRWDDVPLSLTLLDSQRCHTNHTLEFNITDEFLGAVQSVHELVNDKLRAVSVVDAVANLQMTVFVVSDAQLVKVVSHHTNNPIVTRPQLLIQGMLDVMLYARCCSMFRYQPPPCVFFCIELSPDPRFCILCCCVSVWSVSYHDMTWQQ